MKSSNAAMLSHVREKMRACMISALIVPSSDAHNSEYVAPHLQRRAFISNFHGSAGTVVITHDHALLWTDGRYWLEAASALYGEFELMKQGKLEVPSVEDWLRAHLRTEDKVGLDPYVCTVAEWERLSKVIRLHPVDDLIAPLMAAPRSVVPLYARPAQYCGASCREKRAALLEAMAEQQCDFMLLSALDEIAWLTNLRGADVPYNPVFYAYATVDRNEEKVRVYVQLDKVPAALRTACGNDIHFLPYEQLPKDLPQLVAKRRVLLDERQTSEAIYRLLVSHDAVVRRVECGPAQKLKAIKNAVELQGYRDCHVRDGAALTRYLAWLHNEIAERQNTTLTEYAAAEQLERLRAEDKAHFVQLSFNTISSTGPNAAMCHYCAPATGSACIARDALYLVDSGAQYFDGTTDVTRTVCFTATPRPEEREAYTLVLKGHIALHNTAFPRGCAGVRLDVLARHALWQQGLDYAHGTGHGVGSFLNVHEGPHGIGARPVPTNATVDLHTIVSNEPGYYKDGGFGIRIENLEEVVQKPTRYSPDGFLGFSYLTLVPLCRELIDVALLTAAEREWVNKYHADVAAALMPLLQKCNDELAIKYLRHHTQPLAQEPAHI